MMRENIGWLKSPHSKALGIYVDLTHWINASFTDVWTWNVVLSSIIIEDIYNPDKIPNNPAKNPI